MNLVACDGSWLHGSGGELICSGALQVVVGGGPFGLPPITYEEANLLLGAIASLWGSVWLFKQHRRIL